MTDLLTEARAVLEDAAEWIERGSLHGDHEERIIDRLRLVAWKIERALELDGAAERMAEMTSTFLSDLPEDERNRRLQAFKASVDALDPEGYEGAPCPCETEAARLEALSRDEPIPAGQTRKGPCETLAHASHDW